MTDGQNDKDALVALARDIVGAGATIEILRTGSRLSDGTAIISIRDGRSRSVLQISPVDHPDVVAEGCGHAKAFAARIGPDLASPVLLPLAEGRSGRRSYALLPYRAPFSSARIGWWWQRRLVSPAVLDWLGGVAGLREAADTYPVNLAALMAIEGLRADIGDLAAQALRSVEHGAVMPCHIPMHGDLWRGNILTAGPVYGWPFTLIDWRGSAVAGYPIFDLVRLASSYRVSRTRLRDELRRHADLLGCTVPATRVHLLAALGHYAEHIGNMPLPAFNAMAQACVDVHGWAIGA